MTTVGEFPDIFSGLHSGLFSVCTFWQKRPSRRVVNSLISEMDRYNLVLLMVDVGTRFITPLTIDSKKHV